MPSPTSKWLVTVDTSGKYSVNEVARQLERSGFVVDDVMEAIGVISGSPKGPSVSALRKVKGVIDVAPDTAIDIGPPGGKVTW